MNVQKYLNKIEIKHNIFKEMKRVNSFYHFSIS